VTAAARHVTVATERAVFKRDDLLAVMAIARRAATPSELCVDLVLLRFQTRGVAMSKEEAEEIAKEIITAATYRPPPM
jgi:hypothetical protein